MDRRAGARARVCAGGGWGGGKALALAAAYGNSRAEGGRRQHLITFQVTPRHGVVLSGRRQLGGAWRSQASTVFSVSSFRAASGHGTLPRWRRLPRHRALRAAAAASLEPPKAVGGAGKAAGAVHQHWAPPFIVYWMRAEPDLKALPVSADIV